jgi:hypothetical protein
MTDFEKTICELFAEGYPNTAVSVYVEATGARVVDAILAVHAIAGKFNIEPHELSVCTTVNNGELITGLVDRKKH